MNTFDTTLLVVEINRLYEETKKKFLPRIKQDKRPIQVGGTFYGSTPLFHTVGTHFDKKIGYKKHGYASFSYYDFVFQVGGQHTSEFLSFKDAFIASFQSMLTEIMARYGFVFENRFFVKGNVRILFVEDVEHGTNFSTYCGIQILIRDPHTMYKENRIDTNVLQQLTQ